MATVKIPCPGCGADVEVDVTQDATGKTAGILHLTGPHEDHWPTPAVTPVDGM